MGNLRPNREPQALQGVNPRACPGCGRPYLQTRATQRHCRPACRVRALRKRREVSALHLLSTGIAAGHVEPDVIHDAADGFRPAVAGTVMRWLVDLLVRLLWASTDGLVRFDAAMVAGVLKGVGVWRLGQLVSNGGGVLGPTATRVPAAEGGIRGVQCDRRRPRTGPGCSRPSRPYSGRRRTPRQKRRRRRERRADDCGPDAPGCRKAAQAASGDHHPRGPDNGGGRSPVLHEDCSSGTVRANPGLALTSIEEPPSAAL